jgi:hypothetical protein
MGKFGGCNPERQPRAERRIRPTRLRPGDGGSKNAKEDGRQMNRGDKVELSRIRRRKLG